MCAVVRSENGQQRIIARISGVPIPANISHCLPHSHDTASFAQMASRSFSRGCRTGNSIITIFGWNWLRSPLERMTPKKPVGTGHQRRTEGQIRLAFVAYSSRHGDVRQSGLGQGKADGRSGRGGSRDRFTAAASTRHRSSRGVARASRGLSGARYEGRKNWLLDVNQQDEGRVSGSIA